MLTQGRRTAHQAKFPVLPPRRHDLVRTARLRECRHGTGRLVPQEIARVDCAGALIEDLAPFTGARTRNLRANYYLQVSVPTKKRLVNGAARPGNHLSHRRNHILFYRGPAFSRLTMTARAYRPLFAAGLVARVRILGTPADSVCGRP